MDQGTQGAYYLEVIDNDGTAGPYQTSSTITITATGGTTIIGYGYYEFDDEVDFLELPPYHGFGDLFRDVEESRFLLATGRGVKPQKVRWMSKGRSTWY
jgi:hypothetical protein